MWLFGAITDFDNKNENECQEEKAAVKLRLMQRLAG